MTLNTTLFFSFLTVFSFCTEQNNKTVEKHFEKPTSIIKGDTVVQIGEEIRCVFQDTKDNFWFATNGEGVFKYDGKTIVQFTEKHGLCCNFVWNIHEGKDGKIWFKTRDAVCYFNGKTFTNISETNPIFINPNYNYLSDDLLEGYYYDGNALIKIQLPQTSPLKNDRNVRFFYDIYCTFKDSKGHLWFGTQNAGVCKFDGKTYTWLDNEALGAPIRSIFEDKKGNIWIGNNGSGLFCYDGENLTNFTKERNLENPNFKINLQTKKGTLARVWSITDDNLGNIWIGTIDNGVWKFDGKNLTNYTTKDGLGTDIIWTIFKDRNNKLWFGTDGFGVYNFDGKTFKKFTSK